MDINNYNPFDTDPFFMRPELAIKASRDGRCGYCGRKIEGKKYWGDVFTRTIWGPPSMSLESSGYHTSVNICEACHRKELESEKSQLEGRLSRLKEELEGVMIFDSKK